MVNGVYTGTKSNNPGGSLVASKNQSGFHLTALALIIVVLGVAGLVAWRVIKSSSKNQPKNTTSQTSASTPDTSGEISKIDTAKLAFDQQAAASDPIGDKNGPFYHDVYTASSTDGLHFTASGNKIAEHASVPDAIKLPSGQLVFYAVDGAQRSKSGVLMGVSGDNGKTWKLGSMQLSGVSGGIADPQITITDSGQLRLYYLVFPGPPVPGQPPASVNTVDSSTSTDGINFTKESGDRLEYAQITDPDVIKIGSTWFMYAAQGQKQIYATSSDGLSFSYKGVTRQQGSVSKTVSTSGDKYRQFYCDKGISSSITSDGISWTDEGANLAAPAGKIICDPSPVQLDDGSWLMIYKVANPQR